MLRILSWTLLAVALVVAAVGAGVWWLGAGVGGELHGRGEVASSRTPRAVVAERQRAQAQAAARLAGAAQEAPKQILFGDLHVHSTFSSDAYLFSLPIIQGEGLHPPADACDFARICASLDFFSINDHAELLSPRQWSETRQSIRECNEVSRGEAGEVPDLVAFLGWEWTDMAPEAPAEHFGHKNVMFLGTGDDEVPRRPIGARSTAIDQVVTQMGVRGGALMAWPDFPEVDPYLDFNRYRREVVGIDICPDGVDVRELPADCFEVARTPDALFEKLDRWGFDSLVIPHGTGWGIHAPANASLSTQLRLHDPQRQRLFEVYSGHGSSEVYRSWRHAESDRDGNPVCPAPSRGFTPCCWQAGELIRARCGDVSDEVCEERVERARGYFLAAGLDPRRFSVVPDAVSEDWLDCGTLTDGFLGAYVYRPQMSAQYGLALGDFSDPASTRRYRYGLIASSDNHKARAGSGYKEFARKAMGDAWGFRSDVVEAFPGTMGRGAEPVPHDAVPGGKLLQPERGASFYYTGGLVAVHSAGRHRKDVWRGLVEREVYGTSGDRILLWFDLLNGEAGRVPMGGEAAQAQPPRFRVRAAGAFEQQPGCPDHALRRLTPERLQRLCLGECYHPTDRRKRISRIEVVRIRPQRSADEDVAALIEDPWRVFGCGGDPAGCSVEFEDPDFPIGRREAVYYVRAIQEPSPAVGGDPLRCETDEAGRCLRSRPCYASGPGFDPRDDCTAPVEERAWSSPIFLVPSGGLASSARTGEGSSLPPGPRW